MKTIDINYSFLHPLYQYILPNYQTNQTSNYLTNFICWLVHFCNYFIFGRYMLYCAVLQLFYFWQVYAILCSFAIILFLAGICYYVIVSYLVLKFIIIISKSYLHMKSYGHSKILIRMFF